PAFPSTTLFRSAGAHAVDREPGDVCAETCEQPDCAAQREALIPLLSGGSDRDLPDLRCGYGVVTAEQVAHDGNDDVIGAGVGVEPIGARPPERGTKCVN